MIVDCHTHIWESANQLGIAQPAALRRGQCDPLSPTNETQLEASPARHIEAAEPADKTFVLGFKSRHLNAEIPNTYIAQHVRRHPQKLVGVAGIDPTNLPEALADLRRAREEFGFSAITVSPAAQDFHPADSRAMQIYAEAARLRMPVFIHPGIHMSAEAKLDFARPVLLDEIAREFPSLKMVIAHLGFPWIDECICLLGKHPNVYADISALLSRPWQAYHALQSAYQYGVISKLLFGSDFPYNTATTAIESLYRINQLVIGTNLPTVPRPQLAAIVERDVLSILGMTTGPSSPTTPHPTILDAHEA